MTQQDEDFRCSSCGEMLCTKDGGHASLFMACIMTRKRAVGMFRDCEVSEYACVCSRECFDKVRAEWPRCEVAPATLGVVNSAAVFEVDGEVLALQWGSPWWTT